MNRKFLIVQPISHAAGLAIMFYLDGTWALKDSFAIIMVTVSLSLLTTSVLKFLVINHSRKTNKAEVEVDSDLLLDCTYEGLIILPFKQSILQ